MAEPIPYTIAWDRTHWFDPPEVFDELRAQGPLTRMTYPDGHLGWLATDYRAVRSVLGDPRFSHSLELGHFPVTKFGQPIPPFPAQPGMFIHMDPPDHGRYRRLLTGEFTARRMRTLAEGAETVAAEQIAVLREQGSPADLVAHFAKPLVLRTLCTLVGLPYADREEFADAPAIMHDPDSGPEEIGQAFGRCFAYLAGLIQRRREQPGDDLLSRLAAATADDGRALTDEELCNIVVLLLFAGYETTEAALAVGVFALLAHPAQLAALRADTSRVDDAVEELLRYLTVNQYETFRTALEDVEVEGRAVAKGETVTVSLPAANRDPAKFACPADLDLTRDTAGHLAFGHGIHQCLGQNLARVELRAGLLALLAAFPDLRLAVSPEQVPLRTRTSVFGVPSLPVAW